MKSINIKIIVSFILFFSPHLFGLSIEDIPVQDRGRIKPFDTFARNHLLTIYGKRSIKETEMSATDWLIEIMIDSEKAKDQKVFNIINPEVASNLSLKWNSKHKFSFNEISAEIKNHLLLINQIHKKEPNLRTVFESQFYTLHNNIIIFEELSLLRGICLIPPDKDIQKDVWLSPYDFIMGHVRANENQKKLLESLQSYLKSRAINDSDKMEKELQNYKSILESFSNKNINIYSFKIETWMNKANLLYKSLAFYILSFIVFLIGIFVKRALNKFAFFLMILGFFFHGSQIFLRMYIMNRPPVSTLYESIIFVSSIIIFISIILEIFRKDGLAIFCGTISGAVLHFISFSYAYDGDTLGMLVAVLDSNFWLATHVTTISIGYGASLMAGMIGHLYLIKKILNINDKRSLKSIYDNLLGLTLLALFFTLLGTILGGIWADQSWGRFWGWDPKENGALVIILWQLMILHLRLSGLIKGSEFALGMVINNIIVVLAWFGVNLLQVGLHSYGFDDGVAKNLFIFISFEVVCGFGLYFLSSQKRSDLFPEE